MTELNKGPKSDHCTAIILAAGKGLRMGGETRKQFMEVGGMPLFAYSLQTMDRCGFITDIMVTVPEGDQEYCREILERYGLGGKVRKIVAGGRERCFSVHNALQAIDWPCDYVFIQDSARPFLEEGTKDVWQVQTPQVFDFELIKKAHERMVEQYDELLEKGVIITDDAMVAEYFTGTKVKLVMASYRNIKVTTPEDMETVSAYMKEKS